MHHADALLFDFSSLAEKNMRLFGNLPYNISTPLIFHLLKYTASVKDMLFMLQKEVADRLSASPRTKQYGRLSVMVQYYCKAEKLFEVDSDAFLPAPKVRSAVIRLIPHPQKSLCAKDEKFFGALVKAAFAARRKTLKNALKIFLPEIESMINSKNEIANINLAVRAETLSVDDFVRLSNWFIKQIEI